MYYDCADENWVEKLTPERRAELDEVSNAETARAIAQSLYRRPKALAGCCWRQGRGRQSGNGREWGDYAFHVFLRHKALSDRRRDDASPEPLGQLSQRPPAGAVRRGDQLEVEGL